MRDLSTIEYVERLDRYQNAHISRADPSVALRLDPSEWLDASPEWAALVELIIADPELRGSLVEYADDALLQPGQERYALYRSAIAPFLSRYIANQEALDWSEEAFTRTFDELLDFMSRETVTTIEEIPLDGFRSSLAGIPLDIGLRIEVLTDEAKRSLFEREVAGKSDGWPVAFTIIDISEWTHLLVVEHEEYKGRMTGATLPKSLAEAFGDAKARKRLALLALRVLQPGRLQTHCEFTRTPRPAFDRQRAFVSMSQGFAGGETYRLAEDQVDQLRQIYGWLRSRASNRLELSLGRFDQLYERRDAGDRLVDCWIILENLFLSDGGQELSYRVSLRAAHYIGSTKEARKELFQTLRDSYRVRSNLVHGSTADVELVADATEEAVRQALTRALADPASLTVRALDDGLFH